MPYLFNLCYGIALTLLFPLLAIRAFLTGRYRSGLAEKLIGMKKPHIDFARPLVLFHGVSVGEIHLLSVIVRAFIKRHPEWICVVSTTTETGMCEARKRFADLRLIFWPFDFSWAVKRTLTALKPSLIILAESELWPNFLHVAAKRSIPVMIINGRLSPRSANRYRKVAWLARPLMFSRISKFVMQTECYASSLVNLGIERHRISVTGSIKYDGALSDRRNPQTMALASRLGILEEELILVAGSTHAPEEEIVLDVFRRLREKHTALRLVLVPRSPDRFDEVARLINGFAFSFIRMSKTTATPLDRPAVILLDTLGDLNAAWGLADIGFTGGSLDGKRGGQSMIEPAGLGVPVVFGPHVWNFRDAAQRLIDSNAAIMVHSAKSMEQELLRLLDDPAIRQRMGVAARALVVAQQGATERTLDVIDEVLGIAHSGAESIAA